MDEDKQAEPRLPLQGEGDYIGARQYQDAQQEFARKGPVGEKSREAAEALDGPEAEDLEAARKTAAEGDPRHQNPDKA